MAYARPVRTSFFGTLISVVLLVICLDSTPTPVLAKSFFEGHTFRYPSGTTITVYLALDLLKPNDIDRSAIVQEGISRWADRLTDRGVSLSFVSGSAPVGCTNCVAVTYVSDGTPVGDKQVDHDNVGIGTCHVTGDDISDGEIYLNNDYFTTMDHEDEKNELRNISEHEFGHNLGLADSASGGVMDHSQRTTQRTFNDDDKAELCSLYGTASTGGAEEPQAEAEKVAGGIDQGFVTYELTFVPVNAVPIPGDPEHVAFVALGIPPAYVTEVTPPPGWIALVVQGPLSAEDPFFIRDHYMVDGFNVPEPWSPSLPPYFLALRTSASQAAADGVPAGVDPAVGWDTPQISIDVSLAPGLSDCTVEIWAGGDVQLVDGPFRIGPIVGLRFGPAKSRLAWSRAAGVAVYDVVKGELNQLRDVGGDFGASLDACLTEDGAAAESQDPANPLPGQSFFYVVRGQGCGPDGSYDEATGTQVAGRDPGIASSPHACL